jgi:hypothetical protein
MAREVRVWGTRVYLDEILAEFKDLDPFGWG